MIAILSQFKVGQNIVEYLTDEETKRVGLLIYPLRKDLHKIPKRSHLFTPEKNKLRTWKVDSLVQIKRTGDACPDGFAQGRTMRNSGTVDLLQYDSQQVFKENKKTTIVTLLRHKKEFCCSHFLSWHDEEEGFESYTTFQNTSKKPITLEMIASFSLGGVSPFDEADAREQLQVHRFRSSWSAEGRLESRILEDLQLERSWNGHGVVSERFGQIGSMPVKGFFPFVAVEDSRAGVVWGAQLAWAGSWQMEVYRRDDCVSISGGLADYEFGHWKKTIQSGESFETPKASLAVVRGNLEDCCHILTSMQQRAMNNHPAVESDLPIICNEWCTSWGKPSHDSLINLAKRIQGTPVKYLVIDAGWYTRDKDPEGSWGLGQGDWIPSKKLFPKGLKATCDAIRSFGLIPGLWFEMEVCGKNSPLYKKADQLLKRDGAVISIGGRRFWDFTQKKVIKHLTERVIDLLEEANIGYLKVDYNETIGMGVDHPDSLGEGLRVHIEAVQNFFKLIRERLPNLVIENCSSGGHRLEPSMLALTSMSSFSDAHETVEIPIIAANVQNLILPSQSQIWAVIRKTDNSKRIGYSLSAAFLGRMCLSGDLIDLNPQQWNLVVRAQEMYGRISKILKNGKSRRHGSSIKNFSHPSGWQGIVRTTLDTKEALVVLHSFEIKTPETISIPLLKGRNWQIKETFDALGMHIKIEGDYLTCQLKESFSGAVVHLTS
jgi:alpha-galactosidase